MSHGFCRNSFEIAIIPPSSSHRIFTDKLSLLAIVLLTITLMRLALDNLHMGEKLA